jgi:hypothetical protein
MDQWKSGLDKLINDVIQQNINVSSSSCFSGLFNQDAAIKVNISNIDELRLLTKEMVKPAT